MYQGPCSEVAFWFPAMPYLTLRMQLFRPLNNRTLVFTSHDVCSFRSYAQRGCHQHVTIPKIK